MTSEPANLLIAVLCLASFVFAGGFTHTLVTEYSDLQFVIQSGTSAIECPPDRVIRPCASGSGSANRWQLQLSPPFLENLINVNSSGIVTVKGSTSESSTPDSTSGSGTPSSSSPTDGTQGGAETGTASPHLGDQDRPTSHETSAPPTTNHGAGGLGLGAEFDWILWPVLALLGGLGLVGLILSLRRSPLNTTGDVLHVVALGPMVLISNIIRLATRITERLQAAWAAGWARFGELSEARPAFDIQPIGQRFIGPGRLLTMLSKWVNDIIHRLEQPSASAPSGGQASRGAKPTEHLPRFADSEFDVRRAWGWFAQLVNGGDHPGRTPDDIARDAVDRGFPQSAVADLLTAFRDVTYGGQSPSVDRLKDARQAYDRLRESELTSDPGDE